MVKVPLKFYKSLTNGKVSYQVLPSAGVGPGLTEVKDLSEIQSEIGRFTGKTDAWSQRYLSTLQEGLKKVQSGISPFALDPKGVLTTQKALASQEAERKALAEGTMVNIGTEEAPLLVPKGSPAEQLATAPPKLKPIVQEMQIAAGQIPGIQAGIERLRAPTTEAPGAELPGITAEDLGITEDLGVTADSGAARRERIEKDIEAGIERPERIDFVSEWEAMRSERGVTALEDQLNASKDDLRTLEAQIREELVDEEGRLTSIDIIGVRQQEIVKTKQRQIDFILRKQQSIIDQLNTANSVIDTYMNLMKMTYDDAKTEYNQQLSLNLKILDILKSDEADELKAAEANWSLITGSIQSALQSGNIASYDEIPEAIKLKLRSLELQQELPAGFTELVLSNINPTKKIKTTITSKDKSEITYMYEDGSSEVFSTELIPEAGKEMGQYGLTTAQERTFWSAIDKGKNELQQGENWGNVWNRVKQQFPGVPNEAIDNALGVSWRKPGAFEEFKARGKTGGGTSDNFYDGL